LSLEFRHIAHAYGAVRALEDISFTAPTGEITCLLGASGCGKSTLLGLAAGLLTVQQGSIALDGDVLADERASPPPAAGEERGEIRVGLRADLLQARAHGEQPVIQQVWRQARRVF
jgi:ABC-type Fe3+/spermidine/putrescine transport system ATPase subunit